MMDIGEDVVVRRGSAPVERGFGVFILIQSIYKNRELVRELTKREISDLHAGQAAGVIWLLVHPLTLFLVYTVLFTLVFQVRIGTAGPSDYIVYLFSGLTPWLLTQDVLARSTNIMLANQTIVKKVMFPIEVLVAKMLASTLVVQSVLLGLALIFIVSIRGLTPMWLALPILLGAHILLLWGLSLLLSSATPYFRDLGEVVRLFLTVNIYLIPVMYVPGMLPGALRYVLFVNPFSHLIWCYQDVLYYNRFAHPYAWFVLAVFTIAILFSGSYVFLRLRHFFASVL